MDFSECHKSKKVWVEHILLYKTHMQVGNLKPYTLKPKNQNK
jgi:hypothetical protein